MRMPTHFVGRTRELHELRRFLTGRRNVVVTGPFGSGRTTLVRRLESLLWPEYRFVFASLTDTRASIRRTVTAAFTPARNSLRPSDSMSRRRVVLVLDDVVRVTGQRARFIREMLTDERVHMILIAERTLTGDALIRVRATLGAAPVLHLGPLTGPDVERYVAQRLDIAGIRWSFSSIRSTARSINGYPLGMRLMMDAAMGRLKASS